MNIFTFIKDIIETRKRNTKFINLVNELKQIELDEIKRLEKRKTDLLINITATHKNLIHCKEKGFVGVIPNVIRYLDKQITELHTLNYLISNISSNLKNN